MNPTIATFGRSESTNTTLTVGPGGNWSTGVDSNWNVAGTPVGQPAGGGSIRQISRIGIITTPPRSGLPSSGVSTGGAGGALSPGSTIGDADGAALSPGAGVAAGPPPCGIGSTWGSVTFGGTPPGG